MGTRRSNLHSQVVNSAPKEVHTQFWDKRELAQYLNLSIYTIDAWVSQKRIPFVRIGGRKVMFDKKEIEKWIDQQRVEPTPVEKLDIS
jgi:excisionase family DNA binding protein